MLLERKKQWSCSSLLNLGKAQRVDMGNSTWNLTQFKFQVKQQKNIAQRNLARFLVT